MIGAILRWLPLSLALHSAALAATLLLPRERLLLPLFVDLTLSPALVEPITAGDDRSAARDSAAPPRRQRGAPAPRPSGPSPAAETAAKAPPAAAATAPAPPTAVLATPSPPTPEPPAPSTTAAIPPVAPPSVAPAPEPSAEPSVAAPPAPSETVTASAAPSDASGTTESPAAAGGTAPSAAAGADSGRNAVTGGSGLTGDAGSASTGGGGGGSETLALGISGGDGGAYAAYVALLRRRVQEALTYPSAARRRGMSGTVHLDISIEPTGRIRDVLVVRSSSHEMLDEAALDAVRTLRQVPFPSGVRPRPVRVRLPVVFELR